MKPQLKNAYKCEMVSADCPAALRHERKFLYTPECAFSAADAMQRALQFNPGSIILKAWRGMLGNSGEVVKVGVDEKTKKDVYGYVGGWMEYEVPKHEPYVKPAKPAPQTPHPDFPFDFDSMKKPAKEENQHL